MITDALNTRLIQGFCPGTGTPEIGGLTTIQALEVSTNLLSTLLPAGD